MKIVYLLVCVATYVITVYIGYLFIKTADMNKKISIKEKMLAIVWFSFFVTPQMLMINEVFKWFGMGLE